MECVKKGKKLRWKGKCPTCEAEFVATEGDVEDMYRCGDSRYTQCTECKRSTAEFKLVAYTEVVRSKAKEILPKEMHTKDLPPNGLPWNTD
jgi:hypothetical protein